MDEISLYRRYRPHNFENLVGQDHVKTTLINALKNEHVSHAYLFTGPRGTGKTSSARLLAKALNCEKLKDGFEPCGECDFCKDIADGRLIDLIEIDAASNRGIDEVRDLKEKINFAPTRAKYKIYIIDEVHMMTKEAFNALLKTLEEPPAHAYFILATTEVHKIPETIISRCQRFDFRRIDEKILRERLAFIAKAEGIEVDEDSLKMISKYVDGGMRDAIGLIEQLNLDNKITIANVQEVLGVSNHTLLENLYAHLRVNDTNAALKVVQELHIRGSDLKQFIHDFVELLREKMLTCLSENMLKGVGRLMEMIEIFQTAQKDFNSTIPQLPLEIAVIKLTGKYETPDGTEFIDQAKKNPEAAPRVVEKVVERKVEVKPTKAVESEVAPKKVEAEKVDSGLKNVPVESVAEEPKRVVGEFNFENVKEKWPRIVERLKKPSVRMSLKNCHPIKVEGVNLTLEFNTRFHRDQVMNHDSSVLVEKLLEEFFGTRVKILDELRELEIKPVFESESSSAPMPSSEFSGAGSVEKKAESPGAVDQALEIFGGELM